MAKKVLIKDIATVVGVSTALVSYVMNGREKEKRVGKEVVEKIRKAAKDLNYQPNQIARSLRTGSTNTIGLVVADISNPFFSHLARIIEDEANKYQYAVIIGSSDERNQKSQALVETLLNRQVDGLILVPSEGDDVLVKSLIDRDIPLVLIDRNFENISCNFVMLNNYKATFDATMSLIDNGYRKITMVAYRSSLEHMKSRINGYLSAMGSVGYTVSVKLVEPHVSELLHPMDEIILNSDTEAVLFATNTLSIAGLYAVSRNHLKVPEQLAIVGFDKSEVYDFFVPPVTYIEQPLAEMGQKAVQNLMECINGNNGLMQNSLDSQFVERLSNKKLL
jgi:LacI family transcriptional regulator